MIVLLLNWSLIQVGLFNQQPTNVKFVSKVRLHQAQLTELSIIVMTTATHVPHQPTAVA